MRTLTVGVAFLVAFSLLTIELGPLKAQEPIVSPAQDDSVITLQNDDLPASARVEAWVQLVAMLLRNDEEAATEYLRGFSLSPSSPAVQSLPELHDRLQGEFNLQRLTARYESEGGFHSKSRQPDDEAQEQLYREISSEYQIERSKAWGHEIGRWLVELEAEGINTDVLLRSIETSPQLNVSKGFRNEEPDYRQLRLQDRRFWEELEWELGREVLLPGPGVSQ